MATPFSSECFVACLECDPISVGIVTDSTMPTQASLLGETEIHNPRKVAVSSALQ